MGWRGGLMMNISFWIFHLIPLCILLLLVYVMTWHAFFRRRWAFSNAKQQIYQLKNTIPCGFISRLATVDERERLISTQDNVKWRE